ncbi:LamG domain-containing protein [Paenibacillus alvei]|uniref:LamG domain-containing protein n=1 Tax=Paenibacillus alvei TaxID=44250 RepID=A0ABT4GQX9_PAEAL|nr:LamG domain-containing protein [Paenibacillus alvei]MCY9759085.1 LamG domain-containing protein [Paenibacillus alvei]MCY9768250.1 LamG domain-containing protein [Paenibacillus alvei]
MATQNDGAIHFSGTSGEYVEMGAAGLPTGDNPRSIDFWMKPEDNGSKLMIPVRYGDDSPNMKKIEVIINPLNNDPTTRGKMAVGVGGEMIATKNEVIQTLNDWYHIALTYNGGGLTKGIALYVNGMKQELEAVVGYGNKTPLETTSTQFRFGVDYKGKLDEVRLWNFARLEAQIRADRFQVLTGSETGLVGYWRFEKSSIQTDEVKDYSKTKNNGKTVGNVRFVDGEIALLSGQKVEEIGMPINFDKGACKNTFVDDGKLQLEKLYEIKESDAADHKGQGTEADPYLIRDAYDFFYMRKNPYAYYKLTKNIDFKVGLFEEGRYYGFDFYGCLDGNGYKLLNFTQKIGGVPTGLFTSLNDNCVVKNLFIENVDIEASFAGQGVITPNFNKGVVDRVVVTGKLKTKQANVENVYGGVFGTITGGTATNMYINVNIDTSESINGRFIGILAGYYSAGQLSNIIIEGTLIGNRKSNTIAAIVGYSYAGRTNIYYNTDYNTYNHSVINGSAFIDAAKTERELKDANLFKNWDENVWIITNGMIPKLDGFEKLTHALARNGEWESEVIDLVDNYTAFKNLVSVQEIVGGAKVTILTKTSHDNRIWSPYVKLSGNNTIASPKSRYVRVKIIIQADNSSRKVTEVEGFNGMIDYDNTEYVKIDKGLLTVDYTEQHDLTIDDSYKDKGYTVSTKIYAKHIKRLDRIRAYPR